MKTYKNLYPQIYSFSNLYAAYRKARKGKRNRVAVASFEFDLEHNLLALQTALSCNRRRWVRKRQQRRFGPLPSAGKD